VAFWLVPKAISVGCKRELNCVDSHRPFPNRIEVTAPAALYVKLFA
jgi:hypothetical protein